MVRVKMLKRDPSDYVRETKHDLRRVKRDFSAELHPFEAAREYQRAVNAAKLERVFAKPFLGALSGHSDGVSCLRPHPTRLGLAASASYDGEVRLWSLADRRAAARFRGHSRKAFCRGVSFDPRGDRLVSVGDDKQVLVWDTSGDMVDSANEDRVLDPMDKIVTKGVLMGVSHHRVDRTFATCGDCVTLWDPEMRSPVNEYRWGVDSVHSLKFNQIETNLMGGCASDRSIILYDTRENRPMRKMIMDLRSNELCWNPMEAFVFAVANEDYNTYAFDIRRLKRPLNIYMDHTSAVTCVDYAPTGKELVTGSYDKTIRIYQADQGRSREIYHTKRMQRLTCVAWTRDNRYLLSGSDEMNIRLWKARAAEKLGILKEREKTAVQYAEKLREKFASHPEVRKISRHRHVPKHVLNAQREHRAIKDSQKRKEANRRRHSRPGAVPHVSERDKHVVKEEE